MTTLARLTDAEQRLRDAARATCDHRRRHELNNMLSLVTLLRQALSDTELPRDVESDELLNDVLPALSRVDELLLLAEQWPLLGEIDSAGAA